jgi:hypothetical protein
MEKHVLISSVEKLSKGKGSWLKIGYTDDGKEFHTNIFPKAPGYELIAQGKMLKLTINKNEETGYWNVDKVESAAVPEKKEELSTPSMDKAMDAQKPPQKAQETPVDNKLDTRTRGIALSYAVTLCTGNAIRIDDLINCAHTLEMWMSGEFTPVYKADWINQYLKK